MTKISRTLRLCLGIASIVLLIVFTEIILSQIGGVEFRARAQNPAARPSKYATEYNWSISPAADLGQPGDKVVNLPSCPLGVTGNEPEYWIFISGSGTSEPAKVNGGTCAGDGRPGSLRFTTANAHSGIRDFQRVGRIAGGVDRSAVCSHQSHRQSAIRNGGCAAGRIESLCASLDSRFQHHGGFLRFHRRMLDERHLHFRW